MGKREKNRGFAMDSKMKWSGRALPLLKRLMALVKFPKGRDHRKLFANTWWIDDDKTGLIAKEKRKHHPWVCAYWRHPDNSNIYKVWLMTTKKQSERSSVQIPAHTLRTLNRNGYLSLAVVRLFPEDIIDSGEHIGDLPDAIKEEIRKKLEAYRARRIGS